MDNLVFDFWQKVMTNMWANTLTGTGSPFAWPNQNRKKATNPWRIPVTLSQAISQSFVDLSGDQKEGSGEMNSLSELLLSLMQTGMEGYHALQRKWLEGIGEGRSLPPELDISKAPLIWFENFQKLVFPFLEFPKMSGTLGEDANQLIAKYTAFSAKMGELLYHLYLPMDKASRTMAKQMEETNRESARSGGSEDPGVWFTDLESSYLDLLQSPKYTELLHQTVDAYKDYCQTRQKLYSTRSDPRSNDQDKEMGLSQEIAQLKERLDELLKRVDSQPRMPAE